MILYTQDNDGDERWVTCGFCQAGGDNVVWALNSDASLKDVVAHKRQDFRVIHLLTDGHEMIRVLKRRTISLGAKPCI